MLDKFNEEGEKIKEKNLALRFDLTVPLARLIIKFIKTISVQEIK